VWDLFTSAEADKRSREPLNEARNEDLARAVAAFDADPAARAPLGVPLSLLNK
jgi:hypothetical protein